MIIPLNLECGSCSKSNRVDISLHDRLPPFKCACGHNNVGFLESSISAGFRILFRVDHELLDRKDYSLAIVLAAMAFDCELAKFHHKWVDIESTRIGKDLTDEQLDALLRKHNSVDRKIEYVTGLMFDGGMDAYIKANPDLGAQIATNFPSLTSGSIATAFQKALFWPRNAILHLGKTTGRTLSDATRCRQLATMGIYILQAMDMERRKRVTKEV